MRQRLVAAALLSIAGCGWLDTPPPNAVTTCGTLGVAPAKTDILFVVDDSASMAEEQQILADNFQTFIARLASLPIANDFQIGITTTSVDFEQDDASGTPVVSTVFSPPGSYPNSGQPYPAGALVAVDPATGEYIATAPRILRGESRRDLLGRIPRQAAGVGLHRGAHDDARARYPGPRSEQLRREPRRQRRRLVVLRRGEPRHLRVQEVTCGSGSSRRRSYRSRGAAGSTRRRRTP